METRFLSGEIRTQVENPHTLTGYAVIYNSLSEDLGGFREVILPGALTATLAGSPDIFAFRNHDSDQVLGRTNNGTLNLIEDPAGLRYEITLPDTSYARDLHTLVDRGDISGSSFGFRIGPDDADYTMRDGQLLRTIKSIPYLYEISVVTSPAYASTSVDARALDRARALTVDNSLYFLELDLCLLN